MSMNSSRSSRSSRSTSGPSEPCPCTEDSSSSQSLLSPNCECPRDDHDIIIHEKTCPLFKHETIIYEQDLGECDCCGCTLDKCRCNMAGREAFDKWRSKREVGAMPAVLESTHPLMQRFQESLKQFLLKENAHAEEQILNLREELRLGKQGYEKDLETIYKSDHDTNTQRMMIEEYEATLAQRSIDRESAENRARENNERYKKAKELLEQDMIREREAMEEVEALSALCRQLEEWRDDTESGLTVSHRMSDKMRAEKQARADEKRELDIFIFGLNNEIWKLESKLEMYQKQMEIKNTEMEKITDKVTAYSAELEDLELDKRRLVSLWNSIIVNIKQRDKVYDSVRDDYKALQENYRTLMSNLEITKKMLMEEMQKGKEIAMTKDKLHFDLEHATKLYENEDAKRIGLETHITELTEAIDMTEKDQDMIKTENQQLQIVLKSTVKELEKKSETKLKLENEVLENLQECLLNDKTVEHMANGIRKMRDMARQQELSLMTMENQHAKITFEIEVQRNKHAKNVKILEEGLAKVSEKEKELDQLNQEYDKKSLLLTRKQRELDIINKKFVALKEVFDSKSPQERRVEELEKQIKSLRERTESLQHEWLRLQGHVVKMTEQHHKMITDIHLIGKQIQICEQKTVRIQAEVDNVNQEKARVNRSLRELRGRLEVIERTHKDASQRNVHSQKTNLALTHEYSANLKDAEEEIIQLEEDIEALDKEKINLTQELDRAQREALVWQRKGVIAVELKRNIQNAKSVAGEISQMRSEIHRMEVRREQLRRTSEKLADDLALYVRRRETAVEKSRAHAAVEKSSGVSKETSQSSYHQKLRLAKADVARVTKDLAEGKARIEELQKEQERLDNEINETGKANAQLEEHVADLIKETRETARMKDWLLERVVRNQRLGNELATAIKRQNVRIHKPKATILKETQLARALNSRIKHIVETLQREYPHLSEKLESINNTLNIFSPNSTPAMSIASSCSTEHVRHTLLEEIDTSLNQQLDLLEDIDEKQTAEKEFDATG